MKNKFLRVVLLAGATFLDQAQGGGRHGGGGRMGGGFPAARSAPARGGAGPSFRSMPMRHFGGSRTIYSRQRFSSVGSRSLSTTAFRRHYINSNRLLLLARVSSRPEISTAVIVSRDSETIRVARKTGMVSGGVTGRLRTAEMAHAKSVTETISQQTGESVSSRSIRPTGIAIGTVGATIGGMAIVAVSSTAPG